ncbi:hypothetical protein [Pseudanabaena sp. ABRG5-3]|uniref:hypothetical protein n=1 Tax=Pseudanabaena sp. ABRG5-3 TaxID=685565 RepID=UPI000F816E81|nr:hypothetical protein [Pseudanabaena sp. ABRG5-3]
MWKQTVVSTLFSMEMAKAKSHKALIGVIEMKILADELALREGLHSNPSLKAKNQKPCLARLLIFGL